MREQRARGRCVRLGRKLPNDVQALPGARRGDVEQPCALGRVALAFRASHEIGEPFAVGLARERGRHHDQVVAPVRRGARQPLQRLRFVGTRLARKPEQHDGVELESLGPMHRHDLDALLPWRIGLRLYARERGLQPHGVVEIAAALDVAEQREELLRRRTLGLVVETGGSLERHPRALYPAAESRLPARSERSRELRYHAARSRAAVGAETLEACGLQQQIPDRSAMLVGAESVEIGPTKAAPRRPQHGEPGDSIVEVQQRARQCREILRNRLLAEGVDLDGMHGEPVLAQAFSQPFQVSAVLHEHGDRLLRVRADALRRGSQLRSPPRRRGRRARRACGRIARPRPLASQRYLETPPVPSRSDRRSGTLARTRHSPSSRSPVRCGSCAAA